MRIHENRNRKYKYEEIDEEKEQMKIDAKTKEEDSEQWEPEITEQIRRNKSEHQKRNMWNGRKFIKRGT